MEIYSRSSALLSGQDFTQYPGYVIPKCFQMCCLTVCLLIVSCSTVIEMILPDSEPYLKITQYVQKQKLCTLKMTLEVNAIYNDH